MSKKNDPYRPTLTRPSAYTSSHTHTHRVPEQRNIETTVKSDAKSAERGERASTAGARSGGRGDVRSSENLL